MNTTQSAKEWESLGASVLDYAEKRTKRAAWVRGVTWQPDYAADAIADAYSLYVEWRAENTPENVGHVVHSFIGKAARHVVRQSVRGAKRKPAATGQDAALAAVADAPVPAVDRLLRVVRQLPAELAEIAVHLACGVVEPGSTELARRCGVTDRCIRQRFERLRRHPAMVDLQLAAGVGAAFGLAGE